MQNNMKSNHNEFNVCVCVWTGFIWLEVA